MTEEQKKSLRLKCKALTEKYRGYNFIVDDESCFTLSHTTLPRKDRFYSNNVQLTPDHLKCKYQTKYEPKVMLWMAISSLGMSKPCLSQSGLAVNPFVNKNSLKKYSVRIHSLRNIILQINTYFDPI